MRSSHVSASRHGPVPTRSIQLGRLERHGIEPLRPECAAPMREQPNAPLLLDQAHAVAAEHRQGEAWTHSGFVDRYATAAVNRSVSTESTCPMSRDQSALGEFSTQGCTAASPNAAA